LTPWAGDVTFNAASPGATPSAQKKGSNPVPYGTELHATRYQYGVALTPERLRDRSRAAKAVNALCNLGTVAGNHGRFLFDFSPDSVVFRLTNDPAPRLLYCFDTNDDGRTVTASALLKRIEAGDVMKDELILGVSDLKSPLAEQFKAIGITTLGVKSAGAEAVKRINAALGIKG
jgi:CRISPR-associated protein Cst2